MYVSLYVYGSLYYCICVCVYGLVGASVYVYGMYVGREDVG